MMLESIRDEVLGYGLSRYVVGVFYENGFMGLARHRRHHQRKGLGVVVRSTQDKLKLILQSNTSDAALDIPAESTNTVCTKEDSLFINLADSSARYGEANQK